MHKHISWAKLNSRKTTDEIRDLLVKANVRGVRYNMYKCPLANATGWMVSGLTRWNPRVRKHLPLAPILQSFVKKYDGGAYPELDEREYLT